MTDDPFSGPTVDLDIVLANREARVARRLDVFLTQRRPVVSLTIVMPGPVKDCAASRALRDAALETLSGLFEARGWAAETVDIGNGPAGPEALVSVGIDARDLKQAMVALEDDHPLGRLWDLDVVDPVTGGISRSDLGQRPRQCLICGEPAHACARSRSHAIPDLLAAMKGLIDASRLTLGA
uniref:citrate lyase holo-[acyl-carrier protein] synthase n=1 Tax=Rhodopseudomonas palustris (strain BisA53) TaxID=316055 RepID=Q07L21_RHOP5